MLLIKELKKSVEAKNGVIPDGMAYKKKIVKKIAKKRVRHNRGRYPSKTATVNWTPCISQYARGL